MATVTGISGAWKSIAARLRDELAGKARKCHVLSGNVVRNQTIFPRLAATVFAAAMFWASVCVSVSGESGAERNAAAEPQTEADRSCGEC
jgi:hypothetical protein